MSSHTDDDAAADRDWTALCVATKKELFDDALHCLVHKPTALLATPYDIKSKRAEPAGELFSDWMTEKAERYTQLLRVLSLVDQGKGNTPEARLLAQAALTSCAKDYADNWFEPVAEQKMAQMIAEAPMVRWEMAHG